MKNKKIIFLLLLTLGLSACTEKVAKELEESNASTPILPPTAILNTFEVQVVKTDENDSTVIHLANENADVECKVEAPSLDPNAPVIKDCVIDVNEGDLYANGLSFDINVTGKLCEYVRFKPYKFYSFPPGSSTGTYDTYECDDECACPTDAPPPPNACQFDHSGIDGPNCDEGSHSINRHSITYDETTLLCTDNVTVEVIPCGGDDLACVESPAKDQLPDMSYGGMLTKVTEDEFTKDYSFDAPLDSSLRSNALIANFTRYCSGIDPSLSNMTGLNLSHLDQFARTPVVTLVNASPLNPAGLAYADAPLIGQQSHPLYKVQCLDQAHDVKAEIRFVVREWDRSFAPEESGVSFVRMSGGTTETDSAYDTITSWFNVFNDYLDADDLVDYNGDALHFPLNPYDPLEPTHPYNQPGQPNYFGTQCYAPGGTAPAKFNTYYFIKNDL